MKHSFQILAFTLLVFLTGCGTSHTVDSPPRRHEALVRQRLAELPALRNAGAKVRDVRYSSDRERILVLLDLPADSIALPEIMLKHDGFHRYRGDFFPSNSQNMRNPITIDLGQK